jgi:uncharacterized membrane protein YoaK (UPF0700 family)
MSQVQQPRHIRIKSRVALLLTFAAGCVDIVGFLTLYHTFTAHMTGVTVHLGQDLLERDWPDAAKAACVVVAFLLGSVFGRAVIEVGTRKRVRSIASATLLLEAVLIAAVVPLANAPSHPVTAVLAMLAGAMGMQTATLTRVGSLTVHTTFVTGMVNKLAQLVSHLCFLSYDQLLGRDVSQHRQQVSRKARFIGAIWVLYLAGAVAGTWMTLRWGVRSLLLPACVVAGAVIIDQVTPLSIEEERDEGER